MRIDPIELIINPDANNKKTFYFISGNEFTLMEKTKNVIFDIYNKKSGFNKKKIKNLSQYKSEIGLFESRNIYLIDDVKNIEEDYLDKIKLNEDVFVFISENSPKNKSLKNIFLKRSDSFLIDCYEMNKQIKVRLFNSYLNKKNIILEKDLFWKVVDILDNKYLFFEKELDKLSLLENQNINEDNLIRLISRSSPNIEKIFFRILDKSDVLIDNYNKNISNQNDVYNLFASVKKYCSLIINNDNLNDFENSIPKYLFREKNFLLSLFNYLDNNKRKKIITLVSNTEKTMRINNELTMVICLRFLLNLKRIITS